MPFRRAGLLHARALAVAGHVVGLSGNAQLGNVQPAYAAEGARRDVPGHAVVGKVRHGVAQGREFPVQHSQHARLAGMEHEVVQAEVAVHDGCAAVVARGGRDVLGQPGNELIHLGDRLGDGGLVLAAPAADPALEVVPGLAVVGQAQRGKVHTVKGGNDAVHLVVDGGALGLVHAGQGLLPQHAALDEVHQVKGAADDGLVLTQAVHAGHWHLGGSQGLHDAELAFYGVRRRQQLGHWPGLGAHHIGALRGAQLVGGVGLPAWEFAQLQRPFKAAEVLAQVGLQGMEVEGVCLCGLVGHVRLQCLAARRAWAWPARAKVRLICRCRLRSAASGLRAA